MSFLFTSECVSCGHPDKLADAVSDGVLDAFLEQDPQARVAVETFVTDRLCIVGGEVGSDATVDVEAVARQTMRANGYDDPRASYPVDDVEVMVTIGRQSAEIAAGVVKENPEDPRTVLCDDLIAPEGYGEMIGGSQREDDYDRLLARIREQGLPEESYGWYLDLRRYGTFPHSGFGLGLERTVAWICGVSHIRECIAFPRTLNRLYP